MPMYVVSFSMNPDKKLSAKETRAVYNERDTKDPAYMAQAKRFALIEYFKLEAKEGNATELAQTTFLLNTDYNSHRLYVFLIEILQSRRMFLQESDRIAVIPIDPAMTSGLAEHGPGIVRAWLESISSIHH